MEELSRKPLAKNKNSPEASRIRDRTLSVFLGTQTYYYFGEAGAGKADGEIATKPTS